MTDDFFSVCCDFIQLSSLVIIASGTSYKAIELLTKQHLLDQVNQTTKQNLKNVEKLIP